MHNTFDESSIYKQNSSIMTEDFHKKKYQKLMTSLSVSRVNG